MQYAASQPESNPYAEVAVGVGSILLTEQVMRVTDAVLHVLVHTPHLSKEGLVAGAVGGGYALKDHYRPLFHRMFNVGSTGLDEAE